MFSTDRTWMRAIKSICNIEIRENELAMRAIGILRFIHFLFIFLSSEERLNFKAKNSNSTVTVTALDGHAACAL